MMINKYERAKWDICKQCMKSAIIKESLSPGFVKVKKPNGSIASRSDSRNIIKGLIHGIEHYETNHEWFNFILFKNTNSHLPVLCEDCDYIEKFRKLGVKKDDSKV